MNDIKIGLIVADGDEYAPLQREIEKGEFSVYSFLNRPAHNFCVKGLRGSAEVVAINCGIGKVNAAAAAMHLADIGCNVILNFGLSGGIGGISRGELCLPTAFLEHDFDLTGIGYKPCEKPGQKSVYNSCELLRELFIKTVADAKQGVAVTGDSFICDDQRRAFLSETFKAMCCDMETAAIAYVCDSADIPFMALRRVSDDAGSDAYGNYAEMNTARETLISDLILDFIGILADSETGE